MAEQYWGTPEEQVQQQAIARRQALAQAMMQQGVAPDPAASGALPAGQMFMPRPSPLSAVAKVAQTLMGMYMMREGEKIQQYQAEESEKKRKADTASILQAMQGRPAIPAPSDEAGGGPGYPAVPGSVDAAAKAMMSARDPTMQGYGVKLMMEQYKAEQDRQTNRELLQQAMEAQRKAAIPPWLGEEPTGAFAGDPAAIERELRALPVAEQPGALRALRNQLGGTLPSEPNPLQDVNPFMLTGDPKQAALGTALANIGQKREAQAETLAARAEDRRSREQTAATADQTRKEIAARADETQRYIAELKKPPVGPGGAPLTKGQEAVDRQFGKEYADYQAGGGSADVEKQLRQLDAVAKELETPGNDYTGPARGLLPDKVRSFTNPKAVAAKNRVEEVAQRNLRLVLGAQFTQVEGERLIARAYNDQMSPAENAARVRALANQIRQAAATKEDAARYFEKNGTLAGWKGRIPTLGDFEAAMEQAAPASGGLTPAEQSELEALRKRFGR